MPKRPAVRSVADERASVGGAAAVDKALSLLAQFRRDSGQLSLTELAGGARLYKSTALRLLASLEHAGLVQRHADGRYALGPEVARLHAAYAASFSLEWAVVPALRELVDTTAESASFHVRQGDRRLCLYRIDSPQPVRDSTRAGDLMPVDRGAGGRVIMAFEGARGAPYARIRREGIAVLSGDRVPQLAGVSSPVFGSSGEFIGAVTLTMPSGRLDPHTQPPHVMTAAMQITKRLGGEFPFPVPAEQTGTKPAMVSR